MTTGEHDCTTGDLKIVTLDRDSLSVASRLDTLEAVADAVEANRLSPNTLRQYRSSWGVFCRWCADHQKDPLPADPETLRVYFTDMGSVGKSWSTIQAHRAAIHFVHDSRGLDSPVEDRRVKALLKGLRRTIGVAVTRKKALTLDQLRDACRWVQANAGRGLPAEAIRWHRILGLRNKTILLVGFLGGFRRSELTAMRVRHLDHREEGISVLIPRSKTDQDGKGAYVPLPYVRDRELCAASALDTWLQSSGIEEGPIFRPFDHLGVLQDRPLRPHNVARIVKRAVTGIGLDPSDYAGHSLRSGLVTEAARRGAGVLEIMRRTRHRRVEQIEAYIRRGAAIDEDAITRMLGGIRRGSG